MATEEIYQDGRVRSKRNKALLETGYFFVCKDQKCVQTNVEVDYSPMDLRSENEVERDKKAKIANLVTAESNFLYHTSRSGPLKLNGLSD
jgi:hypothetical protein